MWDQRVSSPLQTYMFSIYTNDKQKGCQGDDIINDNFLVMGRGEKQRQHFSWYDHDCLFFRWKIILKIKKNHCIVS